MINGFSGSFTCCYCVCGNQDKESHSEVTTAVTNVFSEAASRVNPNAQPADVLQVFEMMRDDAALKLTPEEQARANELVKQILEDREIKS